MYRQDNSKTIHKQDDFMNKTKEPLETKNRAGLCWKYLSTGLSTGTICGAAVAGGYCKAVARGQLTGSGFSLKFSTKDSMFFSSASN